MTKATLAQQCIADKVRAMSPEALCALLDCARWADSTGDITEICQSDDAYLEIGEVLVAIEDCL